MKRFKFILALPLALLFMTSCDKDAEVKPDPTEDVQQDAPTESELLAMASQNENEGKSYTQDELLAFSVEGQSLPEGETVWIGNGKRSAGDNLTITPAVSGSYRIYHKYSGSWYQVYSGSASSVGFSLPYNPWTDNCGSSSTYGAWSIVPVGWSCKTFQIKYTNSGGTVDTDQYNCTGFQHHYFKAYKGNYGGGANELAILDGSCSGSTSYCTP